MNPELITPVSYLGHVKNGVVVLDADVPPIPEGQAVRVQPLPSQLNQENILEVQQAFATWTEEDAQLSSEEGDCLQNALTNSSRLRFRSPTLD